MSNISENTKKLLMHGLRNGLGLTISSINAGISPKTTSTLVKLNDGFKNDLVAAVSVGYQTKLALCLASAQDKKYKRWESQVEILKDFISELNVWEQYCKRTEATGDKIMKAILIYRVPEEIATVCGFTKQEFMEYMIDTPHLYMFFRDNNLMTLKETKGSL